MKNANQPKGKNLSKKEIKEQINLKAQTKKLKEIGVKAFNIITKNTDNLLVSNQAIQTFSLVVDQLLVKSNKTIKELELLDGLKGSKAQATIIYKELFKLFENETVDYAKGVMSQMFGKISEYNNLKDIDTKLEDLNIPVFNEKS